MDALTIGRGTQGSDVYLMHLYTDLYRRSYEGYFEAVIQRCKNYETLCIFTPTYYYNDCDVLCTMKKKNKNLLRNKTYSTFKEIVRNFQKLI